MADMSPEEAVTLEYRGRVAIITLNQEKKLNALNQDLYYRFACCMHEIAARDDISITVLTAKGRFFSAYRRRRFHFPLHPQGEDARRHWLKSFVANNLHITHAFYTHPKILVTALNGPAVGLSAALIAFSDFIYAAPHAFLLTPFSSLGLVTEGGASRAFVQRLGISKANEALIMSKKITAEELVATGFVNKIVDVGDAKASDKFLAEVLKEVDDRLGEHLNQESLLKIKALIRRPEREMLDAQGEEFRKIAAGEKKHKL
ncbi:dodecenoyl-CoA isomerase [Coniosporium tulheliwenetii]|uniref:Dodecenoyl-CoA isomerase n=1 Tax=Coniosporium tulheliwenetii TaxID=3383036 RepID=A0ACC2Z4A6_9PEZI|nr:dodecenoyl-CoA isomerase [Cladosporium sp. JES 115]